MIIDSHCHLNEDYIEEDLTLAKSNGIHKMINISVDEKSTNNVIDIINKYHNVYGAIGIHPLYLKDDLNISFLINKSNHKKVVAIGETGLDLYKSKELDKQIKSLEIHIEASRKLDLPLIYHTRNSDNEIMQFIKGNKGVLHSFTGSKELAKYAIDNGFYISFSGIITFKNASAVREVVEYVPLEYVLAETDSPYLSPVPYRGKRNQPSNAKIVVEEIANIKNISFDKTMNTIYNNTINLFPKLNDNRLRSQRN